MLKRPANTNRKVRAALIALSIAFVTVLAMYPDDVVQTATAQARRTRAKRTSAAAPKKYSEFPHDVAAHKIECGSCHKPFPSTNWKTVRPAAEAIPDITDYPRHESCLNCHKQQFFRGRPHPVICTICHTNPGPRDSSRHPFPNPPEVFSASPKGRKAATSDFAIQFPHDKHIDIVTGGTRVSHDVFRTASFSPRTPAEESCAVCHKTMNPEGDSGVEFVTKPPADLGEGFWLKKGTFKSTPNHATCFGCHAQDSGMLPGPTDCAMCHKLRTAPLPPADFDAALATKIGVTDRITLDAWRRRDSTGKFRHEFAPHAELSCDTCHTVAKMNTTDPATKRVTISSCAMCHATATAADGGALNLEWESRKKDAKFQCTKCHVIFGTRPAPDSHKQAIIDAGGTP